MLTDTDERKVKCTDKQTGEFLNYLPARMVLRRGMNLEESLEVFNKDSVSVTMQVAEPMDAPNPNKSR